MKAKYVFLTVNHNIITIILNTLYVLTILTYLILIIPLREMLLKFLNLQASEAQRG